MIRAHTRALVLLLALMLAATARPILAADTPAAATVPATLPRTDIAARADAITALMAGKLSATIAAAPLFNAPLVGADGGVLRVALDLRDDDRGYRAARKNPGSVPGLTAEQARLAIAYAGFLRLSPARQAVVISRHSDRQRAARAAATAGAHEAARRNVVRQQAEALQAYLAGQPVPPEALAFNLLDRGALTRAKANEAALRPLVRPDATASVAAWQAMVAQLRGRILALEPAERLRLDKVQADALLENRAAQAIATLDTDQQAEVSRAVAAARTETSRRLLVQQRQLASLRKSLDAAAVALDSRQTAIATIRPRALDWQQRVAVLVDGGGPAVNADRQFLDLIAALRAVRRELGMALSIPADTSVRLPLLPAADPLLPGDDPRTIALGRQRDRLAGDASRLRSRALSLGWEQRSALYNAMIAMNRARLQLIDAVSPTMRTRVTGFNANGLAQVQRELNQIGLTVRYNMLRGIFEARSGHVLLAGSGASALLLGLELLLVAAVFRVWRRSGGAMLASIENQCREQRQQTLATSFMAFAAGLARKLAPPLDWLVLLLLLDWLFPVVLGQGVVRFGWLILVWLAAAATMVLFIDALAQGGSRDDPRAVLRRRSLRLVIGLVLAVGLTLSLTIAAVGHGAIFNWVLTLCWLLLVPLVIILAGWWRDRIDTLALIGAPGSTVLAWSVRNSEGVAGRIGHIAAGTALLLQGGQSVLARRINQLALIREIAGQRARSKASARVRDDEASGRFSAITLHEADRLSPHGRPQGAQGTFAVPGFDGQPLLAGRLVAVVGERGLGKTTAIETLLADLSPPRQLVLRTGTQGFAGLVTAIADELHCAPSADAIAVALQTTEYAIAVDDVQRLVVPAIGGLDDFDRLVALARASGARGGADAGGRTSWLFAIGGPAWSYLARARADRTIFDDVLHLKRWQMTEIRALVERRTEQAGMAPLFNLDIHNAGTMLFDGDIPPEERVRRQYFDELTRHAAGNPAVALEFWRRSLFHDCDAGTVAVRTCRMPAADALLVMPRASLFVLRAVLQMEIATLPNIALSTDLPMVVIRDSLRVLTQLGVIGEAGDGFRLTLFWFQDVRRLLQRQNLVVGRLT